MKINKLVSLLLILIILSNTTQAFADVHVKGYYRNGTYVKPHYRSNPDGNFNNNWSTYGNVNPYTGEEGTKHYPTYNVSPDTYDLSSYDNSNSVDNSYDQNDENSLQKSEDEDFIATPLESTENINIAAIFINSYDTAEEIAAKEMLVQYFNNINTRSYNPAYDCWVTSWQKKHPYDKFEEGYTDVINTIDEINSVPTKNTIILKGTITALEGWEQTTHQYQFAYTTKKVDGVWKIKKGKLKKLW